MAQDTQKVAASYEARIQQLQREATDVREKVRAHARDVAAIAADASNPVTIRLALQLVSDRLYDTARQRD